MYRQKDGATEASYDRYVNCGLYALDLITGLSLRAPDARLGKRSFAANGSALSMKQDLPKEPVAASSSSRQSVVARHEAG